MGQTKKRDQHVLQKNGCNGRHIILSSSMTSQNDVKIIVADGNTKYSKVNLILIYVSTPIGVQEKESTMSASY